MPVNSTTRQRHADHPTASGVPPEPPEGSPKADAGEASANPARTTTPNGSLPFSHAGQRSDIRQVITDRIVAILEKGEHVFRERFSRAAQRGMPCNGKTGQPYHGANVLLLWEAAIEEGYASNVWLTYKQAASLGAHVRCGERAVLCAYFERQAVKVQSSHDGSAAVDEGGHDALNDDTARASALLCRAFWLFNVAQIDGLPAELIQAEEAPHRFSNAPVVKAMCLVAASGATLRHGYTRAMYVSDLDEIRLPWARQFTSPEAYCATVLHELVHWSGHPTRLRRQFGQRFGDAAYAFEELVAELGSAFLLGHAGLIDATIEGHASYLNSWLQVLKHDRTAIFTAARHASAAFELIVANEVL